MVKRTKKVDCPKQKYKDNKHTYWQKFYLDKKCHLIVMASKGRDNVIFVDKQGFDNYFIALS